MYSVWDEVIHKEKEKSMPKTYTVRYNASPHRHMHPSYKVETIRADDVEVQPDGTVVFSIRRTDSRLITDVYGPDAFIRAKLDREE